MPLKFTDDQKRTLMKYEGAKHSHFAAWESGTCPSRLWLPAICKATGLTMEEVWAKYPLPKNDAGAAVNE